MTGTALLVFGALCLVLALIALGVRVVRRTGTGPTQELPMQVIGRVSVGPRQGLAAVRVGEKVLVVSVGDGGVRQLSELDDDALDLTPGAEGDAGVTRLPGGNGLPGGPVLQRVLRAVGAAALVVGLGLGALAVPDAAVAQSATTTEAASQDGMTALSEALPDLQLAMGDGEDGLRLSGTVGTVLVIGLLTLLPTLLLLMTSFTRILVVLHFLRQALGTQTAPPAQLIAALALLLTAFVMGPTLSRVNDVALEPWMDGQIDEAVMMKQAAGPFRDFMLSQVRESDLATFLEMSRAPAPETVDDIPLTTLVSAFAISELRTAFQIGFVLFLPFLVIDLVVAAVLMSLGMFMLPPVMVSLPFKLLLFVLVDGWALVVHNVVASFG